MISTLDFVYMVLGLGLIPVFVLLSMVLWREYKMMDHVDNILTFAEQTTEVLSNLDRVPKMLATKIMSGLKSFFR